MTRKRIYLYGTLLALPFIGLSYYLLNPAQCPANYTQKQVDASHCVVGANIGGLPLFIISVPIIVIAAVWVISKLKR